MSVSSGPAASSASTSAAVASVRAQLQQLSAGGSVGVAHKDLADKYRAVMDVILSYSEHDLVEGLKAFIEAIVNENVSVCVL